MRLHHLRAEAFGPFADPVEVDFDALSEAGLFLLTGATGAGKTSVLDAVCFALYGAVPGDRQGAKRLRSDHAPREVSPSVSLELTVRGRRFRIVRSPAWDRPRKRGRGTTRQQASVLLTERVDGSWTPRATRLDEAGHLVSELLGLTVGQFCQVQMLPQGRFQAFLRADSEERHRLLQRLFRTSRFDDVEQWLRERRRALRRDDDRRRDVVAAVVGRISEASGQPFPEAWDLHSLRPVVDQVGPWAVGLRDRAAAEAASAGSGAESAAVGERAAREVLAEAEALLDRQQRRREAESRAERLAAGREAHWARVVALDAARRADSVLPLLDQADRAEAEAVEAEAEAALRLAAVGDDAVGDLTTLAERATAKAAAARSREPDVAELASLEAELASVDERAGELAELVAGVETRADALPDELSRARSAETAALRAEERLPVARAASADAAERLEAARAVVLLVTEKAAAQARHAASVDAAQDLRERWLQVQEARLQGMASEIAGALAVGASCPVCGSADHPHPASPTPGTPGAEAERSARRAVDDAETERHARWLAVHDLQTRIDLARERSAHRTVPVLEREDAAARAALGRLEAHAATLPALTRDREALEAEQAGLLERRTSWQREAAALEARTGELTARAARLRDAIEALLDGTGQASVTALADHLESVAAASRQAVSAAAFRDRAGSAARADRERADAAVGAQRFADGDAVRAAVLPSLLVERVEHEVRDHEAALVAVAEVLADATLESAASATVPDVEALAAEHARVHEELTAARAAVAVSERRRDRLDLLLRDLDAALGDWAPVRADLEVAERMASLADGSSPDNRLRMRLSAYVLASRLSQVVDAANERLARMFDHRYALEHTGSRGVGESRGGLSLRVRDDWTGEARDPATLSGGETFVVSLALALGLADVIAHEAGGSELDTLFVDEGFGALDAETLDQVLDTLDSLREGGRVVGVVSHVTEMQTRIPAQLHVRKRRVGSTLSQTR